VNGADVNTPEKALELYGKLREVHALSVAVLRRGEPINLDYTIR
jgi:general secretion pathway protein C